MELHLGSRNMEASEIVLVVLHLSGPAVAYFYFHFRVCSQYKRLWEDAR